MTTENDSKDSSSKTDNNNINREQTGEDGAGVTGENDEDLFVSAASSMSQEPISSAKDSVSKKSPTRASSAGSSKSASSSANRSSMAGRFFGNTTGATKKIRFYRGSSNASDSERGGDLRKSTHLRRLLRQRKRDQKIMEKSTRNLMGTLDDQVTSSDDESSTKGIAHSQDMDEHTKDLSNRVKAMHDLYIEWVEARKGQEDDFHVPLEVRLNNFTYAVNLKLGSDKVRTVYNASFLYDIAIFLKRLCGKEPPAPKEERVTKVILDKMNLVIEPGKSYLVLGHPGSGKTSLLKAISGRIKTPQRRRQKKHVSLSGEILYNGRSLEQERGQLHIRNVVQYIEQLDYHAPRFTVKETFEFAFQCKSGGTAFREKHWLNEKQKEIIAKYDRESLVVKSNLLGLGLDEVADTFVGDTNIRGVSGGQRRRVTVGEMLQERVPVLCGDEISTGLDATSTFEMIELILKISDPQRARVISLLQPSPETVSLFDEVIVLSEGRIVYAGPIGAVEGYFSSLGFKAPAFMDVADFLQQVSSEGGQYYDPSEEMAEKFPISPTAKELADLFDQSEWGSRIKDKLAAPSQYVWTLEDGKNVESGMMVSRIADIEAVKKRYANSFVRSTWLIFMRFIVLWLRDKRVLIAGAAKNILMGVSVGGVFANNKDITDLQGALFQAGLFIMLSAMQNASSLVLDRPVFFKQSQSNFYSSFPFVMGRTLSTLPQTTTDVVFFGSLLYYIIGLANRDDAGNFFTYIAILIVFAFTMQQQLAIFASFARSDTLQVLSAITCLLYTLFGGYIVAPNTIPSYYYYWAYWINPFAWTYRALVLNEVRSGRWEDPDSVLKQIGFTDRDGTPFGDSWIAWSFLYNGVFFIFASLAVALGLSITRDSVAAKTSQHDDKAERRLEDSNTRQFNIPFVPVTLSFHDICYEVNASTGGSTLRLLNNVNGIFRPGRMCALMGTSGAGKTTLMDVIALRKKTGDISGEVKLNGWPQETISYRRCSGYVEQFDVQSPELTIRETVLFSARLRLQQDLVEDDEDVCAFVDRILASVGLSNLANALVGTDDAGLTFEQKKLLSIAVELGASPSVIFLDEPTSGLDSKAAMIVTDTLRKIADEGRTVVATIHQPSSSVFEMFDELLLLKKGGHVVYHGELGSSSSILINYFHSQGASRIGFGENPANWMLQVMAHDNMSDLDQRWLDSEEFHALKQELGGIYTNHPDLEKKIEYDTEFAALRRRRQDLVSKRLRLIYWRSPAYNLSRLLVSAAIAFIIASAFITQRDQTVYSETDMRARFSVIFLAFIITGIMAILSVLPVMTKIRDMFYRHRASGMYDSLSIGWALGSAEKLFIMLSCLIFVIVFQATGSFNQKIYRGVVGFWGFFTFNFAIYSYFGQAFVCLVEPPASAIILSSVFIGLNNFFAGLIVRPQLMVGGFYAIPYYICPGHYVYEGLLITIYRDDDSQVIAEDNSEFYNSLRCTPTQLEVCQGSIQDFLGSFFGGEFDESHLLRNGLVLGFILILTRLATWLALKYISF